MKLKRLLAYFLIVFMLFPGTGTSVFALEENGSPEAVSAEAAAESSEAAVEEAVDDAGDASETGEAAVGAEADKKESAETPARVDPPEPKAPAQNAVTNGNTLVYEGGEYTVTLEYGKDAGIPAGTILDVREIRKDSKDKAEKKDYKEYHDQALDALKQERAEDKNNDADIAGLGFARFFDITLMSDGKEIEPKGDVSVKIEFGDDSRDTVRKAKGAEDSIRVVHLTENEKTGKIEAAAIDKKDTEMSLEKKELAETSFTTDSFSVYGIVYTVDFEDDNKQAGKTETVVEAKGKTFRMEAAYDTDAGIPAVAQVSNDGGTTWKKFASLISGNYDGETLEGAFNYANSLTGDVIIEMLYDEHERYTLSSGFIFNNSDITSLTINGVDIDDTDKKTTLVKNQTDAPMITTNGIGTVGFNQIIFNGNGPMTVTGNGGAVNTDAGSLTVSDCIFNNCQAGKTGSTPGQGGGICHDNNAGEVSITNCEFNNCKANGKEDIAAGGGGVFTNALKATVTGSKFIGCQTASRQGAGFFHRRAKTDPANSITIVKDCKFENCEAKWSGGGIETDAWNVTLDTVIFTNCKGTKGGAINVWADGQDASSNNTSLSIANCTFTDCSSSDNGGAIRSTSLATNIAGSTFERCSSNANGGALNCTNSNTVTTITDCTFKDCHADSTADKCGNGGAIASAGTKANATTVSRTTIENCSAGKSGGAIRSGNILIDGGTITSCSAGEKGGAVHSGQTIKMIAGSVTGCTTNGDSAALDAATGQSGLTFSGNVKVEGNTGSGGEARDVYLGTDTDRHILVAGTGLGDNASIGIYVADANSAFDNHGKPNQMFAWVGRNSGNPKAVDYNYLDKFFSDRLDNGPMHGKAATEGENYQYRVMWAAPICKIVDGNGEHPFETLRDALAFARGSEITTPMSASNPVKIEMLVDYEIPESDKVALNQASDNIIITTAKTKSEAEDADETYYFEPTFTEEQGRLSTDSEKTAILKRGSNFTSSLFTVSNSGASLRTQNIIFDGANISTTANGSVIKATAGSLTIAGDTTIRNTLTSGNGENGGAIYAKIPVLFTTEEGESLIFENCTVPNREGGVIETTGNKLTINNKGTLKATDCSASYGGFICTDTAGELEINNSGSFLVDNCSAPSGGGAIWTGVFKVQNTGDITFRNCSSASGGAVKANRNTDSIDAFIITNGNGGSVLFDTCTSTGDGGAVYVTTGHTSLTGDESSSIEFAHCTATKAGGAIWTSIFKAENNSGDISFTDCHAGTFGGAIDVERNSGATDTFKITNIGNGTASFSNCSASNYGGAVYVKNGKCTITSENKPVTFEKCVSTNNNNSGNGGAICQDAGDKLTLTNVTFGKADDADSGCTAMVEGGCVYSKGKNADISECAFYYATAGKSDKSVDSHGGAIYFDGWSESMTLSISTCVFNNCSVQTSENKIGHGNGGAVYVDKNAVLSIDNSTFTDCYAHRFGGAVLYENNGGKNVTITNTEFTGCYTEIRGGGAISSDANKTSIDGCTFSNCYDKSSSGGGAIQFHPDNAPGSGSTCSVTNSTFEGCYTVNGNGGAIYNATGNSPLTLTNVSIDGSASTNAKKGSAVFSKSNLKIVNGTIENCVASDSAGGAVNLESGKKVEFEGSAVVYDNKGTGSLSEQQKNVVLDWTSEHNQTIWTTSNGITEQAHIGVYVTGTTSPAASQTQPFKDHGSYKDDFGTYQGSTDNLNRFTNDRVNDANGDPLYGELCPDHTANSLIRWTGYYNVAPTGYDRKYMPYLLILFGGAVLAALTITARRRRSNNTDADPDAGSVQ